MRPFLSPSAVVLQRIYKKVSCHDRTTGSRIRWPTSYTIPRFSSPLPSILSAFEIAHTPLLPHTPYPPSRSLNVSPFSPCTDEAEGRREMISFSSRPSPSPSPLPPCHSSIHRPAASLGQSVDRLTVDGGPFPGAFHLFNQPLSRVR